MSSTSHKEPHKDSGKPHKWASVIKAWADGKEIQYFNESTNVWTSVSLVKVISPWSHPDLQWRIKPERWYRVAEMKGLTLSEWTATADTAIEETSRQNQREFVRWLTERIYY